MRKFVLIGLALASFSAVAQEPTGKIIMFRPGAIMGMGVACPIRYDGKEVVELGRNKFAEWAVPAGRYILTNKTASVEVTVAPGETRYVRCQIKTGFMTGRADLQIVDAASFNAKAAEFEKKDVNAEFAPALPPAPIVTPVDPPQPLNVDAPTPE